MKVSGMRAKWSPMKDPKVTDEAKARVVELIAEGEQCGFGIMEIRYSTYIGPGCAAEHGDITVCADGKIWRMVMPSGQDY